jgi:hypothetical protein
VFVVLPKLVSLYQYQKVRLHYLETEGNDANKPSKGLCQLKWLTVRHQARRLFNMEEYDSASRGAWGS